MRELAQDKCYFLGEARSHVAPDGDDSYAPPRELELECPAELQGTVDPHEEDEGSKQKRSERHDRTVHTLQCTTYALLDTLRDAIYPEGMPRSCSA